MYGEMSCRLTRLCLRITDEVYGGGGGDEYEEEYVIMMVCCIIKWVFSEYNKIRKEIILWM
jgi:hypothetical protein